MLLRLDFDTIILGFSFLGEVEIMRSIEQLTEEILSLPSESRSLLADKLVESLEFDTDSVIQAVWITEAKRRRDEIRDGSVQPISGEDALAQVRRLIET